MPPSANRAFGCMRCVMYEKERLRYVENTERVWDLLTVAVMLVAAALAFVWLLPQ